MSFTQENGYIPPSFDDIISEIRVGINTQFGTSYTVEGFVGTGWYKYAYAIAQKIQLGEVKTSEIFQKLQEYIELTNESIQRPSVSYPGLLDSFDDEGYLVSIKPPNLADAGLIFICVDLLNTDPGYAADKLAVCTLIKQFVTAGIVSQGTETENLTLSNGQAFDFKFNLPTRIPVLLRATIVTSENNLALVPSETVIRQTIFDNLVARYRLGYNFEPERYYNYADAPWAASILFEWSDDDGATYNSTVFDAEYNEVFDYGLEDIEVILS